MVSKIIDKINQENMEKDGTASFSVGDTVKIYAKIYEGDKERIQIFTGMVTARHGSGATETFTVHRDSHGVGVDRVFPVHSPHITKIEVESSTHVRRAKLYFLRNLSGKKARLKAKKRK